jgi:hypothetical protein
VHSYRMKEERPKLIGMVTSAADLDPDPYVFETPESGSISQRYGSGSISQSYGFGSGYFYHQAKIVRKTLIPSFVTL